MQQLPTLSTDCLNRRIKRRCRQRAEQNEGQEPDQNERPFGNVLGDVGNVKAHVKPAVAEQMDNHVKINKQSQHTPKACQLRGAGSGTKRRNG